MKKILIAAVLFGYALVAFADGCVTQTFTQGGRITTCTTCCYFGNCNTTCY